MFKVGQEFAVFPRFKAGQRVEFVPKTWDEFYDNLSAAVPIYLVDASVDAVTNERFIYVKDIMYAEDDPYFGELVRGGGEIIKDEFGGWYRVRVGEKEMSFYKSVLRLKQSIDEQVFMSCLLL